MDPKDAAKEATDVAADKVGAFIRHQRTSAQLSLRKLARMADVSDPYLSQIERGLRNPSADILQRLAEALRISAETLYYQAGILSEPEGDLRARISAELGLTESQKRTLIEIYDSFRTQNAAQAADEASPSPQSAAQGAEDAPASSQNASHGGDDAPSSPIDLPPQAQEEE